MVVEGRDQHQRIFQVRLDVVLHRNKPFHASRAEGSARVGQQVHGMQEIVNHHRFEHVQLKVALASANGDGGVVPHDLTAHHRHRFRLGRVDLPRHDGGTGFVCRQGQFPEPAARPGTQPANVVGDFHQGSGQGVEGPRGRHDGVVSRQLGKLVFCRAERQSRDVGDLVSHHLRKERVSVEAGTDGRAAECQLKQIVQRKVKPSKVGIELSDPARGFLAQR